MIMKGTGVIASTDYRAIKWEGKTKGGNTVQITMSKAINLGNIDWTFAEKSDTVAQVVFTAVYSNTDAASSSTEEPWTITIDSNQASGAAEIMLGAGVFYIDNVAVGLTRGGGQFTVTREYRRINADGDRGAVEGRIVMDASEATLTMNVLELLTRVDDLYPAMSDT